MTTWIELHPSCASGRIVGLFMPGSRRMASGIFACGRFSSTYFMPRLRSTASMRKSSCASSLPFLLVQCFPEIRTASEKQYFSTSFSPLVTSVPPELTMSKMASAS